MIRPTLTVQQQIPVDKPATTRFEITNHVMEWVCRWRIWLRHRSPLAHSLPENRVLSGGHWAELLYLRKMIAGIPVECQPVNSLIIKRYRPAKASSAQSAGHLYRDPGP